MAYVKIDNGSLTIHPDSPEMGASYYIANGYTKWSDQQVIEYQQSHEVFDVTAHTYSKYLLKTNLENVGLWDEVKTMMVDQNFWDDFLLAQDLSMSDVKFQAFYEYIKQQYVNIDIDEVLKESILI